MFKTIIDELGMFHPGKNDKILLPRVQMDNVHYNKSYRSSL